MCGCSIACAPWCARREEDELCCQLRAPWQARQSNVSKYDLRIRQGALCRLKWAAHNRLRLDPFKGDNPSEAERLV